MSHRYRLTPTPEQETVLREHCAHARFVWNLAVEQWSWWWPGRGWAPSWAQQSRQLTEARAAEPWLAAGSNMVQQQALRDFAQAWLRFFAGTHGKPSWRKAGHGEGFRIVGAPGGKWDVRRLSRHVGEVRILKVGWVRFRWSRAVPEAKSYRVTRDRSGRWHVSFAALPEPIPAPGTSSIVGVDRGVAVSAALSTGEMLRCPGLRDTERARMRRLQRRTGRQRVRGRPASNRLKRTYVAVAKLHARGADRRKDWTEKVSTDLARRFDVIRVEDLKVAKMTRSGRGTVSEPGVNVSQKTGLNRAIMLHNWSELVKRLEDKAPGRIERVNPAFTSQRCSACGHSAAESRESQARFRCTACGFTCNADVNAARNIAAGHAATARGGFREVTGPANREPQLVA